MEITREIAAKVLDTVDAGLAQGKGEPVPGQMCVEAAVCYAMGLPHSDRPACVAPALRELKITLNDKAWSSPQARAQGLRRLALAQLGSAGVLDEVEFTRRVAEMTTRKAVPIALRAAARLDPQRAESLEAAAERCDREGSREAANAACAAADDAYAAAYAAANTYANADAADAADAAAAADAADAADAAANTYAYAAYAAYAADAAAAAAAADADAADAADAASTRDRVLAQFAEWVVEILIDMKVPGCQWLDLAPLAA